MSRILPAILPRITVLLVLLITQEAALAAKYFCGRELTAEETAQANQLIGKMSRALPAAAAGWIVSADGGGVDCGEARQPVPAAISARRSYLYMGEAAAADSEQADRARLAEHERKLAALKKEQEQVTAQYREAQAKRDPKIMQPLQQKMRELQQAQAAESRELAKLRGDVQRKAQERKNAEWTASQKQENKASIGLTANQAWFHALYPAGKKIELPGVPLAVQDKREDGLVITQLYFGGKMPAGAQGKVAIDPAGPMLGIQNIAVRIEAYAQPTQQLLQGLDVAALKTLVQP